MKWVWAALSLALCGSGCGSETSRRDAPTRLGAACPGLPRFTACDEVAALDVEVACDTGAESLCAKFHECGMLASYNLDACRRSTVAACRDQLQPARERGQYDGRAAACCFQHWAEGSCESVAWGDDPACSAMARGAQALGADCEEDADCVGSTYCELSRGCPGTCVAYAAPGASCELGERCVDGVACVEGVCRERGCVGASCTGTSDCALGLRCLFEGATGTCRAPRGAGESCDAQSAYCDMHLGCVYTGQDAQGACREPGGLGDACHDDGNCRADYHCAGPDADAPNTCQPAPHEGSPCTVTPESDSCFGQRHLLFACSPSQTCELFPRAGDPCDAGRDQCQYSKCDAASGRCVALERSSTSCQ